MSNLLQPLKTLLRPARQSVKEIVRRGRLVASDLRRFRAIPVEENLVSRYNEDDLPNFDCLVATMKGLYRVTQGKVVRVLQGYFYGITRDQDDWYLFERLGHRGRLIRFRIAELGLCEARQLVSNLSPGCHQIDFIGEQLYVADTYNNRILVFCKEDRGLAHVAEHYPAGPLTDGRQSANYAHMNSVWRQGDWLYLVFHNETSKTGRTSEIVRLNPETHEIVDRVETTAGHAHNVLALEGDFLFCDSKGGRLVHGTTTVFQCDLFTRGLSVTDRYVTVGKSELGLREERERLAGEITVMDRAFSRRLDVSLPGMVQEIRAVNLAEYGLSRNSHLVDPVDRGPTSRAPSMETR